MNFTLPGRPSSALRHWDVVECSEVADSVLAGMPELDPMKRWLTWTVYATPLMTLTTDLGLFIRVSMFEHVDWWLGPLPRSHGMGEGRDWWSWPMGVIAKGIPRGCQGLFTPVSLGYPLSVFNKNSTLKQTNEGFEHIGLPAKLLDYFLWSNKSNINQMRERRAILDLADPVRFEENFRASRITDRTWPHQSNTLQITARGGQAHQLLSINRFLRWKEKISWHMRSRKTRAEKFLAMPNAACLQLGVALCSIWDWAVRAWMLSLTPGQSLRTCGWNLSPLATPLPPYASSKNETHCTQQRSTSNRKSGE